jgi:cytochrome-b5 reductase
MISINLIAPEGEQYVIDSLFVRLPTDENSEDTLTDLEIEMSLAEVVPSQGELKRSSTHSRPVLGPGYGLKDWIRFCRRSQDLAGTYGQEKKITPSELAKHCTEDDAWTAINGEPLLLARTLVAAFARTTAVKEQGTAARVERLQECTSFTFLLLLCTGRVYNITPYLKYHPGSVEEVMKGAGKDCTSLFNEVSKPSPLVLV